MKDKICMVTGATAGIGKETARALAEMGARVIVVGRNPEKCTHVVQDIRQETNNQAVDCLLADLSDQSQVRQLALQFKESYPHLHVLVNNAGAAFLWRKQTVDGLEMTFALNHLAYFLLTVQLLDVLKASAPARVVNVASSSHYGQRIDFDDLQITRGYNYRKAYGRSKLANILFSNELARRLDGSGATSNALHPGLVATEMGKNNGPLAKLVVPIFMRMRGALSPQEGARTSAYLASSDEVEGVTGEYFVKCKVRQADEAAYDESAAKRLWVASESLVGLGVE